MAFGEQPSLTGNKYLGISTRVIFHRSLVRSEGLRDTAAILCTVKPLIFPTSKISNPLVVPVLAESRRLR